MCYQWASRLFTALTSVISHWNMFDFFITSLPQLFSQDCLYTMLKMSLFAYFVRLLYVCHLCHWWARWSISLVGTSHWSSDTFDFACDSSSIFLQFFTFSNPYYYIVVLPPHLAVIVCNLFVTNIWLISPKLIAIFKLLLVDCLALLSLSLSSYLCSPKARQFPAPVMVISSNMSHCNKLD